MSAIECYRRALSYNDENGSAHKRLADALAIIGQNEEALKEFGVASQLLPRDICCATHVFYGNLNVQQEKGPLKMAEGSAAKKLNDLEWDAQILTNKDEEVMSKMAAAFERDGVMVLPGLVSPRDCDAILQVVEETISKGQAMSETAETLDFTDETRAAANRLHFSLPLRGNHTDAVSDLFGTLYPLLARILQCSEDKIPLLGSGFMRTSPRAKGQQLHKDVHHYDRHLPMDGMPAVTSDPRCVSIQLQLSDTSAGAGAMGSLEVLPGSHRPDAPNGRPATIEKAVNDPLVRDNGVIPIDVPAGTVTIYSSRLWHRGGSNDSNDSARTFAFFTLVEPNCLAPPGLIHTMERQDIGGWRVSSDGLLRQKA